MYSSPYVIWMIKSRRIWCALYLAHMGGEESCAQSFDGETWGKETTWKIQT